MNEQHITALPAGPYLVTGSVPVTSKQPIMSEHGEPLTWKTQAADEVREKAALCRCARAPEPGHVVPVRAVIVEAALRRIAQGGQLLGVTSAPTSQRSTTSPTPPITRSSPCPTPSSPTTRRQRSR